MTEAFSLHRIPVSEVLNAWRRDFDLDVSKYFDGCTEIDVRFDPVTSLVTFEPSPCGDERLYEALSRVDWYYLNRKWEHLECIAQLGPQSRVLEVGSGRGDFLDALQEFGHRGLGLELNSDGARQARDRGLDVKTINLFDAPDDWQNTFDAAAAFQVLEHVPDPLAFCKKLLELVRPGGFLLVAVPNRRSFARAFERTNILDMPPHHITRWDRSALSFLGERLGAKRTRILFSPLEAVHIDWYLDSLRHTSLGRLVFSNATATKLLRSALRRGARKLIRGHSVVARFDKA